MTDTNTVLTVTRYSDTIANAFCGGRSFSHHTDVDIDLDGVMILMMVITFLCRCLWCTKHPMGTILLNLSVKLTTDEANDNREVGDDVGEDKWCFQKIVPCLDLFTTQT